MKAISAAIVVLAGMACLTAGAFVRHGDTQMFIMWSSGAVATVGLWQWFTAMQPPDDRRE